ncbi:hypothetical protein QBC37DRAFT_154067 [Rhypophila decipiens]|uniref:Uncharacterized protein n=1 Tax=Rhypophila decipiens TaxID=261697 RepID=A0AAN7BDE9_9PEZI|nr:hypothetical protein QBC37DRAFT_154067 [Rhypophila decipiens]
MVRYNFIVFAGLAVALPLNINLGAYSPALVVGDGEISFGGRQDVSSLINALEGAAVNAAAGAAREGGRESVTAAAAPAVQAAPAAAAATPVAVDAAASADPTLTEQAQQIAAIQGLGKAKEIAPREGDEAAPKKRDLAGFDRALQYAEAALVKGPKIELGTGAEGSGVGIIVDNNASRGGAEAGAREKKKKRDVDETTAAAPRRRARVTTMYVRRGVPASLQGTASEVVAREITPDQHQQARAAPVPVSAPARRDAIDALNLNVDGEAGLTMTFIEAVDDDDEE